FILYMKNGARIYLALLFLISFLGVLSDQLMFISITFPILGLSFFLKKSPYDKKKLLLTGGLTALSSILGMLAFILLRNLNAISFGSDHKIFAFDDIFNSIQVYLKYTLSIISHLNLNSLILLIAIFSIIIGIVISSNSVIQKKKINDLSFYILFSTLFSLMMIVAPLVNGNFTGIDCFRYNIYPYYLGILNLPLLIIRSKPWVNRVSALGISVLAGYYIILIINSFSITRLKAFSEYYPNKVKSIDRIAREEGLLKGIGNYWDAKFITMFSKQNVRVYAVHSNLTKYYHVANENWFNADTAIFNFVIDRDINHTAITEVFYLDTIRYIQSSTSIIKVPEFTYEDGQSAPVLLDPGIK
ncbi:MAG: hypothetical protein U9N53_14015, partial [Bacteroidota bacterium]|nr:hypothetical protein [Bacteroidota bacterium]